MAVVDGAAFGPEIDLIDKLDLQERFNVSVCVPESFEWLILNSGILQSAEIFEILENPGKHIESKDYFSWEQFFTYLLQETTKNTVFAYKKKKINKRMLTTENIHKIMEWLKNRL